MIMSVVTIGLLALLAFIVLMVLGIPIPFAMIFTGAIGILIMKDPAVASQIMTAELLSTFSSYNLTVGPMFGLMGFFASYSGVGAKLFNSINYFIGHKKGGLASATEVACAGFGAICGSSAACVSTMSAVAYPEMRKKGYSPELAGSCIAAGAALAVLIPPSNHLIIYGLATETSIGRLFIAGIIPGILLMLANIATIVWIGWRHPEWTSAGEKHTWKERWQSITHGGLIEIIIVFIISMGGMFSGLFTPTEAGAVGAFGMFAVTLVSRQMNIEKFLRSMISGARLQAMVFMLLASANIFGKMFTLSRIPGIIGNWVASLEIAGWMVLAVIILIYFILGMFVDIMSMVLITMPIFFPIVVDMLGYSPIWFGVIVILMVTVGGLTPPFGVMVFITKGCVSPIDPEATLQKLFSSIWPFVVAKMAVVVIVIAIPALADWLP
jgi:tripartite ATP-independent transporter DctM subunit